MEKENEKPLEDTETRLEKLELKILEQEHRIIPAFLNLFKKWDNKKERIAAVRAIAFVLFSSGTATAVGITITAVMGVIIANRANEILDRQNALIDDQNTFTENQTFLEESTRRSALTFELSSILDKIDEELDLQEVENPELITAPNRQLSSRLNGRIIALSNSLKPYKYLDENGELTRPLSPERGQLLISIVNSYLFTDYMQSKMNFSYADLEGIDLFKQNASYVNLSQMNLNHANLKKGNFYGARFVSTNLAWADLENSLMRYANLSYANLKKANLEGCDFEGAYLPNAEMFAGAKMDSIELRLNTVLDPLWLDKFFALPNAPKNYKREDFSITQDRERDYSFFPSIPTVLDTITRVVYRIRNEKKPSTAERLNIDNPGLYYVPPQE
ncbi:MAG: pentapeptide repeat-containing protein [Flavobacteriaceae bacterium]|nr:pentapeptide repeat-containing protein [Flavobacteriaceae bacterium]